MRLRKGSFWCLPGLQIVLWELTQWNGRGWLVEKKTTLFLHFFPPSSPSSHLSILSFPLLSHTCCLFFSGLLESRNKSKTNPYYSNNLFLQAIFLWTKAIAVKNQTFPYKPHFWKSIHRFLIHSFVHHSSFNIYWAYNVLGIQFIFQIDYFQFFFFF